MLVRIGYIFINLDIGVPGGVAKLLGQPYQIC
jgi:hypothetical protein